MAHTTTKLLGELIPPLELSVDEARIIDDFQEVIDRDLAPLARENDARGRFPTESVAVLKRSGILAGSVPKADGGPGLSTVALLELKVRLAAVDPATAQVFKTHDELVREIAIYCPPERRRRFLDDVLGGAFIGLAVAEGTRTVSDPLQTLATRTGDGGWVVNGTKIYTTGAAEADWIALWAFDPTAATPENPLTGMVQFLVPRDHPGVTVHRDWNVMGQRATDSGTITFDQIRLADSDRSNAPGFGPLPWTSVLYQIGFAALLVGAGLGALRQAADFVTTRSRPWPTSGVDNAGDDPLVRRTMGELATELAAAYALTMQAGALLESMEDPSHWFPRAPYAVPIYAAKAAASRAAVRATTEVFAMAGTRSVSASVGWDRLWRDVRTMALHDPLDWKYEEIGHHVLRGWEPPPGIYQ
jgi:alkylation response protein AidB-like acyl-CoA dehydrogenase